MARIALLKRAVQLGKAFSDATTTHQAVAFASHVGAAKPNASKLDDKAPPLQALLTATSSMLSSESVDAACAEMPDKPVAPDDGKLPHISAAVIAIAAKAGLGVVAGRDLQLANGNAISVMSGRIHKSLPAGICAFTAGRRSACWTGSSRRARTTSACS